MKGLSIILLARAAADAVDISAINNKDTTNNNIDTRFQRALRWNWSFFNNNNNDKYDIQEVGDINEDMTMTNGDIVEEIPWAGGFVLGDTDPPSNRPTRLSTKVSDYILYLISKLNLFFFINLTLLNCFVLCSNQQ